MVNRPPIVRGIDLVALLADHHVGGKEPSRAAGTKPGWSPAAVRRWRTVGARRKPASPWFFQTGGILCETQKPPDRVLGRRLGGGRPPRPPGRVGGRGVSR